MVDVLGLVESGSLVDWLLVSSARVVVFPFDRISLLVLAVIFGVDGVTVCGDGTVVVEATEAVVGIVFAGLNFLLSRTGVLNVLCIMPCEAVGNVTSWLGALSWTDGNFGSGVFSVL